MSDVLVKVKNVSKKFCRDLKRSLWYGMQDLGNELLGRRHGGDGELRDGEFWATKDVSFTLERGECLGLIGHNGAGKTTLLRMLNGLIKPDQGSIEIRGRVGALIALGAGFNPILTGKENIYINASILGLSKREIDSRLEAIVDFSELEEFIDSPVQTYSSGMHVRLGFAVAVHLQPDVMLVDEALAVGDARFQKKCHDRIQLMQAQGTGFIVVSHNPYQIESLCQKVVVMHQGSMSQVNEGKKALDLYHDLVQQSLRPSIDTLKTLRVGTGDLTIEALRFETETGSNQHSVATMENLRFVVVINTPRPLVGVRFRLEICSANNSIIIMANTLGLSEQRVFVGTQTLAFVMSPCQLTSGWYYVNVIAGDGIIRFDTWQHAGEFKVIQNEGSSRNLSTDQGAFVCQGHWEFH